MDAKQELAAVAAEMKKRGLGELATRLEAAASAVTAGPQHAPPPDQLAQMLFNAANSLYDARGGDFRRVQSALHDAHMDMTGTGITYRDKDFGPLAQRFQHVNKQLYDLDHAIGAACSAAEALARDIKKVRVTK